MTMAAPSSTRTGQKIAFLTPLLRVRSWYRVRSLSSICFGYPRRTVRLRCQAVPDKRILGGAAAGAIAAGVWAAQEPLDIKLSGVDYSDPQLLAKPFGGSRVVGVPLHLTNGAGFGAVYALVAPHVPGPP